MPFVLMKQSTNFLVAVTPLSSLQESLTAGRQRELVFYEHLGLGSAAETKRDKPS